MSEKRFTFADEFKIVAIKDNDKIMNSRQVCNKLNELNNENKELKSLLKECEHELTCDNGLSAFDKCASYIGYVEVFDKDIIDLDHSKLLERIKQKMR